MSRSFLCLMPWQRMLFLEGLVMDFSAYYHPHNRNSPSPMANVPGRILDGWWPLVMWRGGYRCRFGVEVSCVYPISYMQDIRAEGAKKGGALSFEITKKYRHACASCLTLFYAAGVKKFLGVQCCPQGKILGGTPILQLQAPRGGPYNKTSTTTIARHTTHKTARLQQQHLQHQKTAKFPAAEKTQQTAPHTLLRLTTHSGQQQLQHPQHQSAPHQTKNNKTTPNPNKVALG